MRRDRIGAIERGALFVLAEVVLLAAGIAAAVSGAPGVGLALGVLGFAASMGAALSV